MTDNDKTKTELVMENVHLRRKLAETEARAERMEKRYKGQLAHNEELELAVKTRNAELKERGERIKEMEGRVSLTDSERRILDMWPRFEDGEPVMRGDMTEDLGGEITEIEFFDGNGCVLWNNACNHMHFEHGQRVKRPAPEVLDADGVPIKVGDKLYDTETGCGRTVRSINANGSIEFDGLETRGWLTCRFTHTEPVFDADGVPINVGDTVYGKDGNRLTVDRLCKGHVGVKEFPAGVLFNPSSLTHREPDSWDRLMRDASQLSCVYAGAEGNDMSGYECETCRLFPGRGRGVPCEAAMALECVARAKALAGIEVE